MKLYSQKDPQYSSLKLGTTTIGRDGCVVMALSNILQLDPKEILRIGIFNKRGECDIKKTIENAGGKMVYRGKKKPLGWCIAKTIYFLNYGVPTHFFCLNDTEVIDSLDLPPYRKANPYPVAEYIQIEGIALDFTREDLEKKLKVAMSSLHHLVGMRKNAVIRFIERLTRYLT